MPPGPNLEGYTPTPGRKIYDDASGVTDAYTSGLGNANVSPFLDIAQGLDKGIDLANKANKFLEDIGPTGAERRRLELETERARASTLQSQATIAAIKAKADALNEQAIITQEGLSYQQQINQLETSIQNGNLVKEGLSGIGQIQDAASLTAYISDPKFGPIGADPVWGANIRNKAALLMGGASSQDQISLIRAAEAASPGSGDKLKNLASADVQRQLADPREQAYLESARTKANAPAKVTPEQKFTNGVQADFGSVINQVEKAVQGRKIDDVDVDYTDGTIVLRDRNSNTNFASIPVTKYSDATEKGRAASRIQAQQVDQFIKEFKTGHFAPVDEAEPGSPIKAAPGTPAQDPAQSAPMGSPAAAVSMQSKTKVAELRSAVLGDDQNTALDTDFQELLIAASGPLSSTYTKDSFIRGYIKRIVTEKSPKMDPKIVDAMAENAVQYFKTLEQRDKIKQDLRKKAVEQEKQKIWVGATNPKLTSGATRPIMGLKGSGVAN